MLLLLKASIIVTFLLVANAFTSLKRRVPVKAFRSSNQDDSDYNQQPINTPESSLWSERVEYVDLNAKYEEDPSSRSMPLFLLSGAFYPRGMTYLNVFEMKYRTMMYDVSNADDIFGYVHSNPQTGQMASIGTICKITDRQLLDDGRQFVSLEGISRFRVTKILKTLPYILAEVVPLASDDAPQDEEAAAELERDVYKALKYYMRLMKSYKSNKDMVASFALKKCRYTAPLVKSALSENERRTDFSFALANMIQMTEAKESQLMLQTTSVIKRLQVEKEILTQASNLVADQLIEMTVITADQRDGIKLKAYLDNDPDDDILPLGDSLVNEVEEEKDEWDIANME